MYLNILRSCKAHSQLSVAVLQSPKRAWVLINVPISKNSMKICKPMNCFTAAGRERPKGAISKCKMRNKVWRMSTDCTSSKLCLLRVVYSICDNVFICSQYHRFRDYFFTLLPLISKKIICIRLHNISVFVIVSQLEKYCGQDFIL